MSLSTGGGTVAADLDALVALLGAVDAAGPAADFPWGRAAEFDTAGLYSWCVDPAGAAMLSDSLEIEVNLGLIYAGQAGATAWPSGKQRTSTLLRRIRKNHLRGPLKRSTLRRALAASLASPLGLAQDGRFGAVEEAALSAWMGEHLRVSAVVYPDRDSLAEVERSVLTALDPPLNLVHMPATPLRVQLRSRRAAAGQRPRALDGSGDSFSV
jgi:hypothetical protein